MAKLDAIFEYLKKYLDASPEIEFIKSQRDVDLDLIYAWHPEYGKSKKVYLSKLYFNNKLHSIVIGCDCCEERIEFYPDSATCSFDADYYEEVDIRVYADRKLCPHFQCNPFLQEIFRYFFIDNVDPERDFYGLIMKRNQLGFPDIVTKRKPRYVIQRKCKCRACGAVEHEDTMFSLIQDDFPTSDQVMDKLASVLGTGTSLHLCDVDEYGKSATFGVLDTIGYFVYKED